MRKAGRILGTLMIAAGVLTLTWAFVVWRWEDPLTSAVNHLEQRELASSFERRLESFASGPSQPVADDPGAARRALARAAREYRRETKRGDAVARLRVPRIGLDAVIVNGTDAETLKRGPGRWLGSTMPGQGGLFYVAGHRTTYGAPFSRIDRLRKGDRVTVELPYATVEYEVTGHRIVAATEVSVLKGRGREELALQACHPRFFASHRWIAYARPVEVTTRGSDEPVRLLASAG